jgi:hypothetical protein
MMIWRFDEFVHGVVGDRGIIKDDFPAGPRAELDVIITEHLGIKKYHDWGLPDFKPLDDGLGEIRFSYGGIAYRVFGSCAGKAPDGKSVYRLWLTATKNRKRKGKQSTDPPDAIEKAKKRRREYELHNIGRLRPYA